MDVTNASEILVGTRQRSLNEAAIQELMSSIEAVGQLEPIIVFRNKEKKLELVAGMHRLEACRRINKAVRYILTDRNSALMHKMAEVAENLHRAELTVLEKSEHIAAWMRLHEEHDPPEDKEDQPRQDDAVNKGGRDADGKPKEGGVRKAARGLNLPEVAVRRSKDIAGVAPEAKAAAIGQGLADNQSALLEIAKTAPGKQAAKALEIGAVKRAKKERKAGPAATLDPKEAHAARSFVNGTAPVPENTPDTVFEAYRSLSPEYRSRVREWIEAFEEEQNDPDVEPASPTESAEPEAGEPEPWS